ncbi:CPBP family intramembrane metalloprotease [Bacillus megaterium]|nr:CPBP family intramembrane metalloprotease [Priestia megaterium]
MLIILIGNKGVHGSSTADIVLILLTQTLVIAFVEMVFRGFMLNLLLSKSYKVAVLLSSFLFAFTHSLNMLSGWIGSKYNFSNFICICYWVGLGFTDR